MLASRNRRSYAQSARAIARPWPVLTDAVSGPSGEGWIWQLEMTPAPPPFPFLGSAGLWRLGRSFI
eukprot:3301033-Prymnesium_polylepis.1